MKSIILLGMLVVSFASCDTTSTASGKEPQADSASVNRMSSDSSSTKMSTSTTDTSMNKTDTSATKKDTTKPQ